MKVFIAGATGALGQPLVRALVHRGHEVIGLTRSASKRTLLESLGARVAVANALDEDALQRALIQAAPTHVVHLLTALPPGGPMRVKDLDATNELRVRGTANLLREVFDYDYDVIAGMLDTTDTNCRQLLSRAKARVAEGRPRFHGESESQRRLVDRSSARCSAAMRLSSRRCSRMTWRSGPTAEERPWRPAVRCSAVTRG
jgi:NAD(P)-dependent dehydrogenase (short-subunit alcohol dehydrogenase family)